MDIDALRLKVRLMIKAPAKLVHDCEALVDSMADTAHAVKAADDAIQELKARMEITKERLDTVLDTFR